MNATILGNLLSKKFGLAAVVVAAIVFVELPKDNIVALTIIALAYMVAQGAIDYARARKAGDNGH